MLERFLKLRLPEVLKVRYEYVGALAAWGKDDLQCV